MGWSIRTPAPNHATTDRHRGSGHPPTPATPPCIRVRTRRFESVIPEPLKIGASTPYDFTARNLTAYGGLLPVATMLEKLAFQQLVEETAVGRIGEPAEHQIPPEGI